MILLILVFVTTGFVSIGLAIPLINGRVAPNRLYGLRTRATLSNDTVWYEANARSGRDLLLFGVGIVVLAVSLPLGVGSSLEEYGLAMSALLVLGAVALCVVGVRRADRLLAEHRDTAP